MCLSTESDSKTPPPSSPLAAPDRRVFSVENSLRLSNRAPKMTIETGGIHTGRGIWYDTLIRKGTAKVSPPEAHGMQEKNCMERKGWAE